MKKILVLFFISCAFICSAQKKDVRDGAYSSYLYNVEVPEGITVGTIDSTTSVYQDSIIKIDWDFAVTQMGFDLTNKSDQAIKVLWDDAAFISINNESHRIFHKGIKYTDRESAQAPTTVYKNTTLSDLIAPTSYSNYVSGQYGGWRSKPLIPYANKGLSIRLIYDENLIGRTLKVILPIVVGEKTITYTFSFRTEFIEKKKR